MTRSRSFYFLSRYENYDRRWGLSDCVSFTRPRLQMAAWACRSVPYFRPVRRHRCGAVRVFRRPRAVPLMWRRSYRSSAVFSCRRRLDSRSILSLSPLSPLSPLFTRSHLMVTLSDRKIRINSYVKSHNRIITQLMPGYARHLHPAGGSPELNTQGRRAPKK